MNHDLTRWRFEAVDSWFFRETRAHDAAGVSELLSVFPPPARTLMGAIRTWLGDQLGVDWRAFARHQADTRLHALLGDADQPGELALAAVVLRHRGETLWPCPADLMLGEQAGKPIVTRLAPGSPVRCDLGRVALPDAAAIAPPGSKVVEGAWLTDSGMARWLAGLAPCPEHIVSLGELVETESRLGIARDSLRGTVKPGLLYQTRHLRFREASTYVEAWVSGVPESVLHDTTAEQTLRLGGEGRMASVTVSKDQGLPLPSTGQAAGRRLVLYLASPALVAEADASCGLPGFMPVTTSEGLDVWVGHLNGVALRMVSSCRRHAYREGGWDQRRHRPKAVRSYLAPGSVLFCELDDDTPMDDALRQLHGSHFGADTAWGMGRLMATAINWSADGDNHHWFDG